MEVMRKPFQGVGNIIRFNWHFYKIFILVVLLLIGFSFLLTPIGVSLIRGLCTVLLVPVIVSLVVSWYIYDVSDLYTLNWLELDTLKENSLLVNIHAGFDETSSLLAKKYPNARLEVFDFYDPNKHTEISIKRARKAYPLHPDTKLINTQKLPLQTNSIATVFGMLAIHEIRDSTERNAFFNELHRVLRKNGHLIIVEHLRDVPNFLAYTFGVFHFYSKKLWIDTFFQSGFVLKQEIKLTPFISAFILQKHGNSA